MVHKYVVGFLFSEDTERVVLIEKNRPAWQKGKLNGVGGRIERGETALEAMEREFMEETGIGIHKWDEFCRLTGFKEGSSELEWEVNFFRAMGNVDLCKTTTDEVVRIVQWRGVPEHFCVENLAWAIPMAVQGDIISSAVVSITPHNCATKPYEGV